MKSSHSWILLSILQERWREREKETFLYKTNISFLKKNLSKPNNYYAKAYVILLCNWLKLFLSQTRSHIDTYTILKFSHYSPSCL
jgi:hypothetical protein